MGIGPVNCGDALPRLLIGKGSGQRAAAQPRPRRTRADVSHPSRTIQFQAGGHLITAAYRACTQVSCSTMLTTSWKFQATWEGCSSARICAGFLATSTSAADQSEIDESKSMSSAATAVP